MKVEESLNVTFDECPPPTKLSPLVDDDVGEEEAIRNNTKVVNNNNEEDDSIEVDEVINIKESKNHPLDQVKMDDPNITMAEYIRLEEEKARRRGKVYNWETAMYAKICPQHIDEFNLKDETSLSECDEEEQNVICFNDLFPFNVIYPDDSKSDKDNDDDKIDIKQPSRGNVINTDNGAYAQGLNKLLETSHDKSNKIFKTETFIKELNVDIMTWNHLNKRMSFIFLIKNLYVPFGIPFDPKLFYKDEIKLGQV
ncbi:hypothetical protein Tco_0206507 [Tanacetum coccineum]